VIRDVYFFDQGKPSPNPFLLPLIFQFFEKV